ncbi:unnamed protein product [Peniophora sp. CBMAI 1063]|nr:unnamed protein product [Peniophora sp. CBMAI 1063]
MDPGGRPVAHVISDNFKRGEKKQDKSGRYFYECKTCSAIIEHRDNKLLKHLAHNCADATPSQKTAALRHLGSASHKKGKTVFGVIPPESGSAEPVAGGIVNAQLQQHLSDTGEGAVVTVGGQGENVVAVRASKKRARGSMTLDGWIDYPLTDEQIHEANLRLFRFVVSANIPFTAVDNHYFIEFLAFIRPMYESPTRYVLSHSIFDTELANIFLSDRERLRNEKFLTFLIDGWEDALRRSLYGSLAARVGEFPTLLSLEDLTGGRATASGLLDVMKRALAHMDQESGENFIAVTTDNPTTMQAFRRLASSDANYSWLLTFACFLHQTNSIIGEIVSFAPAKAIVSKNTTIVSFFNGSHFWGGQLMKTAEDLKLGARHLRQNVDTRWYAVSLQSQSVIALRQAMTTLCARGDAQRSTNGLSVVKKAVVNAVLRDESFWPLNEQLLRITKPIVDVIGNLEARSCTLAECALELIFCARTVSKMVAEPGDDPALLEHAQTVFSRRFAFMITPIHALALYLHPMCRALALSKATGGGFSYDLMLKTALGIVQKWRFKKGRAVAKALIADMEEYQACRGVFAGGQTDAYTWWTSRPLIRSEHPLRVLAEMLHSIVPHSAEIERLFSQLGGVQTPKRCNLTVENFEGLGRCRSHYSRQLWEQDRKNGKSAHRKHAHMHTRETPGINDELVRKLDEQFTPVEQVVVDGGDEKGDEEVDYAMGELEKGFAKLTVRLAEEGVDKVDITNRDVLKGEMFDFSLLDAVKRGEVLNPYEEEAEIGGAADSDEEWDIDDVVQGSR